MDPAVSRPPPDLIAADFEQLPAVLTTREAANAPRIGVKELRKLVDTGQIPAARFGPRRVIRIGTARHTFASHLVMRGAAMKAVQELLGHATMEMTNRYSHLSPEVPRHAVKLLDGLDRVSELSGRQLGDKAHFST
jgi:site-specific recombinase XerD